MLANLTDEQLRDRLRSLEAQAQRFYQDLREGAWMLAAFGHAASSEHEAEIRRIRLELARRRDEASSQ